MAPNRYTLRRRTHRQVRADERSDQLAAYLGKALRNGREIRGALQREASELAGISQSCWSELERGNGANVSLRVWIRASNATGADLRAYLEQTTGADQPRDAIHLRQQELVARTAEQGGWRIAIEVGIGGPGVADLLLTRDSSRALIETWTWLGDVGDAFRSWDRKLERLRASGEAASGCWVLRATRRNRQLVADHATLFRARFPGSGDAWIATLTRLAFPMPAAPALLWISVRGDRIVPARLRGRR